MAVAGLLAISTSAQATPAEEHAAHVAALDRELAEADYKALRDIVFNAANAQEARVSLDWLGERFRRGESPFIAFTYSQLLASFADQLPAAEADNIKGTALAALIYASSAALVEGQQCADATARSNRMEQFSAILANSGLLELDGPVRESAAFIALAIERSTWEARRARDDARFECANGMAAMTAGIAAGQVTERAAEPGETGRQIGVTPPDDFVFERREDEDWWPDAEKLRARLPALVAALARVDRVPSAEELEATFSRQ